ncbi:MAG TPA: hypothetical protein PKD46_11275 [Aggregatilineaceae bacterium]|nr:hypothetical protein [Aggregatilineaceae bacterium]
MPNALVSLRHATRLVRRALRRAWRVVWRAALAVALAAALGDGIVRDVSLRDHVVTLAQDVLFDYVSWEIDALWGKARQELLGVHPYLDEETRRQRTVAYLDTLREARALEREIEAIYAGPAESDPAAASSALAAERDRLRATLTADQPLVESVIEGQVSAALADAGFATLGQVLPPVSMHFTQVPTLLVVSPRDHIEMEVNVSLDPLTIAQREALESDVDASLDVSSLVVPLGGVGLYPSMIVETDTLARAFEVTAHEWAHHYLMAFPLGLEYTLRPETRIINETVATFFGRAVAQRVMARFYPDLPAPQYPSFLAAAETATPDTPAAFDFGRALHETRATVDAMLARGEIEAAEAYMEQRRRLFVAQGYPIRKLNQAYFAFYGGYQGEPGAGGADPIGPAVEELLALSPSLDAWLRQMRTITTRAELLDALDAARAAHTSP